MSEKRVMLYYIIALDYSGLLCDWSSAHSTVHICRSFHSVFFNNNNNIVNIYVMFHYPML